MGSIEKERTERTILKELCDRVKIEKEDFLDVVTVSPDNVFSVFDVVRKEVPYCRVLLYLICKHWESFKTKVLQGYFEKEDRICLKKESLVALTNEFPCKPPCSIYDKKGRIDILLETKKHVIAIEVKIDAPDQEHQLVRYQKELVNTYSDKKIHIFYLTKNGKSASENSLCCNKACDKCNGDCKIAENGYQRISFQKEIYDWVKFIVETENGNDIAIQFLEVLELERNNNVLKYIGLLKESKEYPLMINSLKSALPVLWKEICTTFFEELGKVMIRNEFVEIEKQSLKNENCVAAFKKDDTCIYFCYQTNLFLRIGPIENGKWTYLARQCFDKEIQQQLFGTKDEKQVAICFTEFASSNQGLVDWYYLHNDPHKVAEADAILETVCKSVDALANS